MKRTLIAAGLIALIALGIVAWQNHKTATFLTEENRQLRSLVAEFEHEKTTAAPIAEPSPSVSPELLRLRGEVAQLRRQTNELATLQKENALLRTELSSATQAAAEAQVTAPSRQTSSDLNRASFPRDTWAFAGYASPEDTLKTAAWAMSIGDPGNFLASLSPTERARMQRRWAGKTEEQIAADSRREMEKTTGFRVIEREIVSAEEIILRVLADGESSDIRRMHMKRFGSDWKLDGVSTVHSKP